MSHQVGCHFIVCIRVRATGNPTEVSYSNQAMHIVQQRKHNGQTTETWWMAGDAFHVMQGMLIRAMLHNKLVSNKLSSSRFRKSFFNKDGDFGFSFEGCATILSIPWHDVNQCSNVIMFFGKSFDQSRPWGLVFCFKSDPKYAHHVFRQFASEYFGDSQVSSQLFATYKECQNNYYRTRYANRGYISFRNQPMHTFSFDAARRFQLITATTYVDILSLIALRNSMIIRCLSYQHWISAYTSMHRNISFRNSGPFYHRIATSIGTATAMT